MPNSAMTSDEVGMQLHDRATRGETLTAEEDLELENWYALQDARESELLEVSNTSSNTSDMKKQIAIALDNLASTTQQIQNVAAENDTLRDEIAVLKQQLTAAKSA